MPAIQVARTDTFEQQRQKINQIGTSLFNITAGGSDLSTGNLKLGDGTRIEPSLAFVSETDLGIYKPSLSTIGVVSNGKKTIDFSNTGTYSFKDFIVERRKLLDSPSSFTVVDYGSGYGAGTYTDVNLIGGTGTGATADFTVIEYDGEITSSGRGYKEGQYIGINLTGGLGTGATASFIVRGVTGLILNEGNNYVPGTYTNVPLTGGNGTGCLATIFVASPGAGTPGGNITSVTITSNGNNNYNTGDILSVSNSSLGGSGSDFQFEITSDNPGQPATFTFNDRGSGYVINDVLTFPGTKTGVTTNLKGEVTGVTSTLNSASNTITVASTEGIVAGMNVFSGQGDAGVIVLGTTVVSVTPTTIVLSQNPSSSGASTLSFRSSGTLTEIVVSSLDGIFLNSTVTQTSGNGQIALGTRVSSISTSDNTITLSSTPLLAGDATLDFVPPFGIPVQAFSYTVGEPGVISSVSISEGGNGYSVSDQLGVNASDLSQEITYFVKNINVQKLYFSSLIGTSFSIGDLIKKLDGAIINSTVSSKTIIAGAADTTYTSVASTTSGFGTGATFTVTRGTFGDVASVIVSPGSAGTKYRSGDTITISGTLVGGTTPADDITLLVTSTSSNTEFAVYKKVLSGSNIDYIITETNQVDLFEDGDQVVKNDDYNNVYTISTASDWSFRYLIDLDDGNGYQLTPSWDVYVGDTYKFDLSDSSNTSHVFALSEYRDGIWGPSYIQNVSTTLSISSTSITVPDTTNILPGMNVTQSSGTGTIGNNTKVLSVPNSTTVILDTSPIVSGSAVLNFRGLTYTDGVTISPGALSLKVTENTPNLYYFCDFNNIAHVDEGGEDFEEALITVETVNPRTFGSGFEILINEIDEESVISLDIESGSVTALAFIGNDASFDDLLVDQTISCPTISTTNLTTTTIVSPSNITLNSPSIINGNLSVSSFLTVSGTNGNLTTSGVIKTTNSLNINDVLTISGNTISTSGTNGIVLSPPTGRTVKINNTTAITIPSGSTAQRPILGIAESGSIRFNTDTNQYEGYSSSTSSWSSLGGVRDLDGNTYIIAEQTIGSNDNTLWFFNDNINTVKFTPEYQEFANVKKIRSLNTSSPNSTIWSSNTPVTTGQYLKYRNNIYEVVSGGVTGTSGNEPIDTTGNNFSDGTATLKFFVTAVAPLTFEEISEVRIAPLGGTSLVVNDEITLSGNTISTKINDLLIQPNTGKKVTISSPTSLVIPVGTSNERGNAAAGSIRFNTTILQYEGYDGTNWSSLGGVRDVDGNTYIIPELSAGSNENILYFYNNGSNTLRVTENDIQLDTIDTINSVTSNTLNLNAQFITFNSLAASIDTSSTSTFISTTKDNLDLGLSSGLANDPLLRLSDTGDIYYNLGFGSGVYNGVKIFDNELKELEIADYKISTTKVDLVRNTINTGSAILYDPALHTSAKVQIIAHNETTGDKEFIEYSVIDKGTDIFFTDFGNVKTGAELISCVFDFNASNNVRVTFTLDSAISSGNVIKVTVISNIIKR